jgi:hypothetical protein
MPHARTASVTTFVAEDDTVVAAAKGGDESAFGLPPTL